MKAAVLRAPGQHQPEPARYKIGDLGQAFEDMEAGRLGRGVVIG